jgi:hypothetical protein
VVSVLAAIYKGVAAAAAAEASGRAAAGAAIDDGLPAVYSRGRTAVAQVSCAAPGISPAATAQRTAAGSYCAPMSIPA